MASKKSLIAAIVSAGLGIAPAELEKKSVAELEALAKENDIVVEEDQPKPTAGKRADDDPRTGKILKCRIEPGHGPGGNDPVFGSVNGFNFYAKRGAEIELDEGFIKHLEGIESGEVVQEIDEKTGKPTGETKVISRRRFQITKL